ncbi:MAG: hypothetical protein KJ697_02000 [Nanoarchaeota archaeon]|nr:hypothetical protein [Nanoarchaeota archaeon]MBU4124453.1 hypothetical protein [Nanoarchaeota archaeon]
MKGFVNALESVIGAVIILSTLMFLFQPAPMKEIGMYDTTYDCLAYAKDYSNFAVKFEECLPSTYDFEYNICVTPECSVNNLPENITVTSAEYITAGPKLIKVWVYK